MRYGRRNSDRLSTEIPFRSQIRTRSLTYYLHNPSGSGRTFDQYATFNASAGTRKLSIYPHKSITCPNYRTDSRNL